MEEHLLSLVFGAFGGGLVSWFFYKIRARWEALREAGLLALEVVDAAQSNVEWKENGQVIPVTKQSGDIAQARKALNVLSLTCKDPKVVEH